MSEHIILRISNVLDKHFGDHIDMGDWASRPEGDRRHCFLQRSLAALCIKNLAATDPETAAKAVTDGFHDNGLDAIYFDQKTDTLFLVQAKWSESGNKPLDADGSAAFVAGAKDLLAGRFERFNEKVKLKEAEVKTALYSERPIKIMLVAVHTATQAIAIHAQRKVDDLVDELNDTVSIAEFMHFDQAGAYALITSETKPPKLKLNIGLKDWGFIDKPFLAYYGRVHVSEIVQWWSEHGNALFSQNLRLFYTNSNVNDALRKTLNNDPESFWYFNNGITVICDVIAKAAVGSPGRQIGLFTCDGASIVNGAQTVGTIGSSGRTKREHDESESDPVESWVQVRIISLEKCPPEFSRAITRAANLQNAVGNREFAAMDPRQHKLATDFALDKRKYVYKQGEPDPKGEEGCSIVEATQALACAKSVTLAVQCKREIGALWADTEAAPYTDLFNDRLTSTQIWRSVLIMRAVDEELHKLRSSNAIKADLIGIHLNRLILHLVFQDKELAPLLHDGAEREDFISSARSSTHRIFPQVAGYILQHHESEYLASLCKNSGKCEDLAAVLIGPARPKNTAQGSLF